MQFPKIPHVISNALINRPDMTREKYYDWWEAAVVQHGVVDEKRFTVILK